MYYISIRQVMINQHKIKCYSLMKNNGIFTIDYLKSDYETEHMEDSSSVIELQDSIPSLDEVVLPSIDEKNAIYFVAGYIYRSVLDQTKCSYCRDLLVSELGHREFSYFQSHHYMRSFSPVEIIENCISKNSLLIMYKYVCQIVKTVILCKLH